MKEERPADYESYKRSEDALNNIYMMVLEEIEKKYAPASPAEKTEGETPDRLKCREIRLRKRFTVSDYNQIFKTLWLYRRFFIISIT
jgi:hypothetical protein